MIRAKGRAASGFKPTLPGGAESLSLESLDISLESLDMSRAKGRAASGFRPKLNSRAESLSLESLDMSCAVGQESLDIPKFGRESLDMGRKSLVRPKIGRKSLDMGRKSLDTGFRDQCQDLDDQILVCPDFRGPRCDSCPEFLDSNSRRDYALWV